jgi:hypothetical protein
MSSRHIERSSTTDQFVKTPEAFCALYVQALLEANAKNKVLSTDPNKCDAFATIADCYHFAKFKTRNYTLYERICEVLTAQLAERDGYEIIGNDGSVAQLVKDRPLHQGAENTAYASYELAKKAFLAKYKVSLFFIFFLLAHSALSRNSLQHLMIR